MSYRIDFMGVIREDDNARDRDIPLVLRQPRKTIPYH